MYHLNTQHDAGARRERDAHAGRDAARHPHGDAAASRRRVAVAAAGAGLFAGFIALGVWQVERRAWKLDLIARVDARVHAAPVAAPGPAHWAAVNAADDEYRHVRADRPLPARPRDAGAGGHRARRRLLGADAAAHGRRQHRAGQSRLRCRRDGARPLPRAGSGRSPRVTGLLRMTEPRRRASCAATIPAPTAGIRATSQAIAAARGLRDVAPYFIDADATPAPARAGAGPSAA